MLSNEKVQEIKKTLGDDKVKELETLEIKDLHGVVKNYSKTIKDTNAALDEKNSAALQYTIYLLDKKNQLIWNT